MTAISFILTNVFIFSYILKSGTCVKASKINFKHRLMDKNINEVCIYILMHSLLIVQKDSNIIFY